MILKRSDVLGTLFYLNFVGTFPPITEDLSEYLDDVHNELNNYNSIVSDENKISSICAVSADIYAAICHKVLLTLREYPEYESILYLNYNAIISITEEYKCKKVLVKVDPVSVPDNPQTMEITQSGLVCYARESVDGEYARNPENYPFYEKIVIYPSYKSMRIFEQVSDDNTYKFIMEMDHFKWNRTKPIPRSVTSNLSIPRSSALTSEYLQELIQAKPEKRKRKEEISVLHYVKFIIFRQACTIAYGQQKYSNHFRINRDKFQSHSLYKQTVMLSYQESFQNFTAYICFGYKIDPEGHEEPTEEYLLMQGIKSDEIILVRKAEYSTPTTPGEPLELIENFQKSYLKFVLYSYHKL